VTVSCKNKKMNKKLAAALLRAFYGDPQVLLLDDQLSAVDSTLARSIYQEAIQELGIKQGKCIRMATHQSQFSGHVETIASF
jgi:ABC-type nitrate/sulfonate/bicarbonate transport system ATPase subunit